MATKTAYELGETIVEGTTRTVRYFRTKPNFSVLDVAREMRVRLLGRRDDPTTADVSVAISDGAGHISYGVTL